MEDLIPKLVDLINNFDPASLLPKVDSIIGWIELAVRLCVMVAPVIMLVFGLTYWFLPAKVNPLERKRQLRQALIAAGFTAPTITPASDDDGQHYVFECEWLGGL